MGPKPRKPSVPAVIAPHQQAGHKTAPDQIAAPTKILATREPSTQDIAPQRSAIWRDARRNFTSARSQIVTFKRGATAAHVDRLMEKLGFALWVKLET